MTTPSDDVRSLADASPETGADASAVMSTAKDLVDFYPLPQVEPQKARGVVGARRAARQFLVQALYQWHVAGTPVDEIEAQFRAEYDVKSADDVFFHEVLQAMPAHMDALDRRIEPLLDRRLTELDFVEWAILRLAAYELTQRPDIPFRVTINESIELAKVFGGTDSHRFVNGVLDKLAERVRCAERAAQVRRTPDMDGSSDIR